MNISKYLQNQTKNLIMSSPLARWWEWTRMEFYGVKLVWELRWFCLPPSHQFDCFHHKGSCFYGWHKVFARIVISLTNGCLMEHPSPQVEYSHLKVTFEKEFDFKEGPSCLYLVQVTCKVLEASNLSSNILIIARVLCHLLWGTIIIDYTLCKPPLSSTDCWCYHLQLYWWWQYLLLSHSGQGRLVMITILIQN